MSHLFSAAARTLLLIAICSAGLLRAQQPACAGNACPMVTISAATSSLGSAQTAATKRVTRATQSAVIQPVLMPDNSKILVVGTQFQNRSTNAVTVSYSPATNITFGKPTTCGSPTTLQLAAGQTQSVSGFLCSPSQVSYVSPQ